MAGGALLLPLAPAGDSWQLPLLPGLEPPVHPLSALEPLIPVPAFEIVPPSIWEFGCSIEQN